MSNVVITLQTIQNPDDLTFVNLRHTLTILGRRTAASAEPTARTNTGMMTGIKKIGLHNLLSSVCYDGLDYGATFTICKVLLTIFSNFFT